MFSRSWSGMGWRYGVCRNPLFIRSYVLTDGYLCRLFWRFPLSQSLIHQVLCSHNQLKRKWRIFYPVAIPYSSGLMFSRRKREMASISDNESQSLIHQVLCSHSFSQQGLSTGRLLGRNPLFIRSYVLTIMCISLLLLCCSSQSLIHQVLCSHVETMGFVPGHYDCVAIPYSSGLMFSQKMIMRINELLISRNPLFIRSYVLTRSDIFWPVWSL